MRLEKQKAIAPDLQNQRDRLYPKPLEIKGFNPIMAKKRYTVKEAKAIAEAAGYHLIDGEGWGDRFYWIFLIGDDIHGECKVWGQKLAPLVEWIKQNPLPVAAEESVAEPETEEVVEEPIRTCATCPFARQIEGNKYSCTAVHNHHNPVTRGHWQSTADCERAIEEEEDNRGSGHTDADVEYVMNLEASPEKSEAQATQQQKFSQLATSTPYGIEIDSIKSDVYRIWGGMNLLGTMRRTSWGWLARLGGGSTSWHSTPDAAQYAVVAAALPH